uniref:Uncharacterized protein n=1 Tax=Timema shepardi TaxID=629360 RepID=A0A7R9AQT0_TIMSH|nr:unnamed protein product [Timema shepardi]
MLSFFMFHYTLEFTLHKDIVCHTIDFGQIQGEDYNSPFTKDELTYTLSPMGGTASSPGYNHYEMLCQLPPARQAFHFFKSLRETDAELGRSSRLLSGMIMRSIQHRFVLFGVAVVFIIVIVLGIYFTVTK